MPTYYLTFASKTPFRNGWVEIEAEDYNEAYDKIIEALGVFIGGEWIIHEEKDFNKSLFPLGKIGETIK